MGFNVHHSLYNSKLEVIDANYSESYNCKSLGFLLFVSSLYFLLTKLQNLATHFQFPFKCSSTLNSSSDPFDHFYRFWYFLVRFVFEAEFRDEKGEEHGKQELL